MKVQNTIQAVKFLQEKIMKIPYKLHKICERFKIGLMNVSPALYLWKHKLPNYLEHLKMRCPTLPFELLSCVVNIRVALKKFILFHCGEKIKHMKSLWGIYLQCRNYTQCIPFYSLLQMFQSFGLSCIYRNVQLDNFEVKPDIKQQMRNVFHHQSTRGILFARFAAFHCLPAQAGLVCGSHRVCTL